MRRDRREFMKGILQGAGLLALGGLHAFAKDNALPNIVLCMADDQGWGDMGYNGHKALKTPNFDAMAAASLRFDRFYAAAPVCSPTRGSVMTGRHPNRFACFSWGHPLRPQEVTLAEALRSAGYVTGHFGKWHLGSVQKGSPVNPGASGFDEWLSAPNFFDNDPILSREGVAISLQGESSMLTVDAAIEFMKKHTKEGRPFLAVVWFGSPHGPHHALEADRDLYADQPERLRDFYGEITAMDRAFGKLRDALAAQHIRENTLLWYCSDNGGLKKVGTTGGRGHKGTLYEGGLRVPALLEWPSLFDEKRICSMPCSTCDIYPTLLDIVGIQPETALPLDGISLLPLFTGRMRQRSRPLGFWHHPTPGIRTPSKEWMQELLEAQQEGRETTDKTRLRLEAGKIERQYPKDRFPGHAAWLDWPWKLHRIDKGKGEVVWELYDLSKDPMETSNAALSEKKKLESLKKGLEGWLASVVRSLNGKDYPSLLDGEDLVP